MANLRRLRSNAFAWQPRRCDADCTRWALRGTRHCAPHMVAAREALGARACRVTSCVAPRLGWTDTCPDHHEEYVARRRLTDPAFEHRLAARRDDGGLVPSLTIAYECYRDPSHDRAYHRDGGDAVRHTVDERRLRVYLFAYLGEDAVGHLSFFLHSANTAFIRKIDVASEHQRRGIASALYDSLRAEHPDVLVDHGARWPDGEAWWAGYCRRRDLNPTSPRS
jgi:GNAT superfamily N-acetyltransferase